MANIEIQYIVHGYTETHKQMETILKEKELISKENGVVSFKSDGAQKLLKEMQDIAKYASELRQQIETIGKNSKLGQNLTQELDKCNTSINKIKKTINELGSDADKSAAAQIKLWDAVDKKQEQIAKKGSLKKQMESDIKDLERYTKEKQDAMRKIYESQNSMTNGKKQTPKELSYLNEVIKNADKNISKLKKNISSLYGKFDGAKKMGSDAIKHSDDAINFTDVNNVQRGARDTLSSLEKQWESLMSQKDKYSDLLGKDSNTVKEIERQLQEINSLREQEKSILEEALNKEKEIGKIDEEEKNHILERVQQEERVAENKREVVKLAQQENDAYRETKNQINEVHNLETRLTQLQKDPKKHTSEIGYLKELIQKKKEQYSLEQKIKNMPEGKKKKELQDLIAKNKELIQQLKKQGQDWLDNEKKVNKFGDTVKKVLTYIAVYRGFQMLQQGIQQALDTMKELDKAFTDIQLVTGDSKEKTQQLAKEYNGLAKELGATTQEVAEGAGEWLRQGKTTEETTQLLKSSMTLSKVGAMESAEATELLTSSLNGYKLEAQDAMSVVDKISSIDLEAATSSYELATALSRTANSANDAGVSFDKLLAMIGTTSSVTRKSASTIRRII